MKKTLWLGGLMVIISLVYATVYLVALQGMRSAANDPQIQLAEDTAAGLDNGGSTFVFQAPQKVDIANSLATFIMIFDANKQLVTTTASLDGNNPVLPPGVLTNTTETSQNRVTWQPRDGVRIAAVVVKYKDGYVLAGRSLREVESREKVSLYIVLVSWLATVGFLLVWAWLTPMVQKKVGAKKASG